MKSGSPQHAANQLLKCSGLRPKLAFILGTGFGHALDLLNEKELVACKTLPGFPPIRVNGQRAQLAIGKLSGAAVIILGGRAHFYEGHPMTAVTFAVRMLAAYGVRDLLLTNAAGAINHAFRPGDFMLVEDHINFIGSNPLRGPAPGKGLSRFVDLSQLYDPVLNRLLLKAAQRSRAKLHAGVYLAVSGPSYETPAEIRAFRKLGADAVGMSTVPEAIVARQCGLRVAAVSCLTNLAAGLAPAPLSHQEVLETASKVQTLAGRLLSCFAALYHRSHEVSD